MKLHTQPKTTLRPKKRLGLGYGSGKGGHTSSRGQKGQKSRSSVRLSFTGSSWVWFKRLPFMRGKSRFNSYGSKVTLITLSMLDQLKSGTKVTLATFAPIKRVKIVANGQLTKKLTVTIPASAPAIKAIEAAGGVYSVKTT